MGEEGRVRIREREREGEAAHNDYIHTSVPVMLGNDVLKSFIVYSRTKIALFGYG